MARAVRIVSLGMALVAVVPGVTWAAARMPAPDPHAPAARPPPAELPSVPPTPVPTPPSSSSSGPPLPRQIIQRIDNAGKRIAITFDACATQTHRYGFDRPVYRLLQRQHVPATIFVSGRWVEFHRRAMRDLAADPLIEFGNHGYAHRHMAKLSDEKIASEIDRTEAALAVYGKRSVAFRPPFGKFSDRVLKVAHDKHLPVVLWDVVSGDPSAAATAQAIVRTVMRKARSGSIVIFHINGRETQTVFALPTILKHLREGGFQFVHVSTLLASPDAVMPPSGGEVPP